MKVEKGGQNGKGLVKQPVLNEIMLSDLKDYKKDMEAENIKMKLLDKEQQRAAKTARGRDWRGGYLMAMVILNANNTSIIALQKERDQWFLEWKRMIQVAENSDKLKDIQKGLSEKGMTRENELKQEYQRKERKYLEVLTLFKQYPDTLMKMLGEGAEPEAIVEALSKIFNDIAAKKKK